MAEQGLTFNDLERMVGRKVDVFIKRDLVSSPQFQTLECILVALGAFKFDDEQVDALIKGEVKKSNNTKTVKIVEHGKKG